MRLLAACLALSAAVATGPVHAQLAGRVSVIDGDSLRMSGLQIRLHGIDAPESAQACVTRGKRWRCGSRASRALRRRIAGRRVSCEPKEQDRHGRIVAVCRVAGQDLGAWMVANGWALAYRRHSRAYVGEERSARSVRRGIWRGEFVAPWDWRRDRRRESAARRPECRIKGNIGSGGKRIYHVPGGKYYERTRISPARGERWFCSESEARAAGWRKARR